jgi:hypothetical protein
MTPDAPQHKPPERENEMTAKVGKIPRDGLGSTLCPRIKAMARNEGFDPKIPGKREKNRKLLRFGGVPRTFV